MGLITLSSGIGDQVKFNPGCAAIETTCSWNLETLNIASIHTIPTKPLIINALIRLHGCA